MKHFGKWIASVGTVVLVTSSFAQYKAPLGAGLEGIADWSRSNAFADLIKQGRGWGKADKPWETGTIAVDAAGWPKGDFGVVVGADWGPLKGMGGVYKLSGYSSQLPTIELPASPGSVQRIKRDAGNGKFTADIVFPEGGEQLMLAFRNTGGGVRNLKLLRPGLTGNDVFTKPFLDHLKRFNVLRFMDWTNTNWNETVTWADRTPLASPFWSGTATRGGVPWEVCINLANTLDKDIWINVPHRANADYVNRLATLVKAQLEPDRKVFLEYSNEV